MFLNNCRCQLLNCFWLLISALKFNHKLMDQLAQKMPFFSFIAVFLHDPPVLPYNLRQLLSVLMQ